MKKRAGRKVSESSWTGGKTVPDAVSSWSEDSENHYRRMAEYFGFSGRRRTSFSGEDSFGFGL